MFNIADFIVVMVNWKQTCSVRMAWCYIQEMTLILQAWSKFYDVGAAWGWNHKYLGKQFSGAHWNRAMLDLHHRSEIVWAKFNEHTDTLLNRHVSVRLRFVFFDFAIIPTNWLDLLTYPLLRINFKSSKWWENVCYVQLLDRHLGG